MNTSGDAGSVNEDKSGISFGLAKTQRRAQNTVFVNGETGRNGFKGRSCQHMSHSALLWSISEGRFLPVFKAQCEQLGASSGNG